MNTPGSYWFQMITEEIRAVILQAQQPTPPPLTPRRISYECRGCGRPLGVKELICSYCGRAT